jgi:hypothetical protein
VINTVQSAVPWSRDHPPLEMEVVSWPDRSMLTLPSNSIVPKRTGCEPLSVWMTMTTVLLQRLRYYRRKPIRVVLSQRESERARERERDYAVMIPSKTPACATVYTVLTVNYGSVTHGWNERARVIRTGGVPAPTRHRARIINTVMDRRCSSMAINKSIL